MPNNYYIIAGPFIETDAETLFWNSNDGWGDYKTATKFDESILFSYLPIESNAIWELTNDGEPVKSYEITNNK